MWFYVFSWIYPLCNGWVFEVCSNLFLAFIQSADDIVFDYILKRRLPGKSVFPLSQKHFCIIEAFFLNRIRHKTADTARLISMPQNLDISFFISINFDEFVKTHKRDGYGKSFPHSGTNPEEWGVLTVRCSDEGWSVTQQLDFLRRRQ